MDNHVEGIVTAKDKLLKRYMDGNKDFYFSTLSYWSTASLHLDVVNPNNGVAFAVLRKSQKVSAFDYAIGQARNDGFGGTTLLATYADTCLTKARQTLGSDELAIFGIRVSLRDVRTKYRDADIPANLDADVDRAFRGLAPWMDISAFFRPPQIDSPFRLEDSLGKHLRSRLGLTFVWDGQNNERIGLASQCPDVQAASLLTTAGLPNVDNFRQLPEGWIWNKPGAQSDTELQLDIVAEQQAVYTINGVVFPGGNTIIYPEAMAFDLLVEFVCVGLGYDSTN